jgi:hypothetical protein
MGLFSGLLGPSDAEKSMSALANAGFNQNIIQKFLPDALRTGTTAPIIQSGIEGIGNLIQNPG